MILIENFAKVPANEIASILPTSFVSMVYTPSSFTEQWPTYSKLISLNKRIIIMTDAGYDPAVPWILNLYDWMTATEFAVFDSAAFNCDYKFNKVKCKYPLMKLHHALSVKITKDIYFPDFENANTTNAFGSISAHLDSCIGKQVTLVAVDYSNVGDIFEVVAKHNNVELVKSLPVKKKAPMKNDTREESSIQAKPTPEDQKSKSMARYSKCSDVLVLFFLILILG